MNAKREIKKNDTTEPEPHQEAHHHHRARESPKPGHDEPGIEARELKKS